MSMKVPSPDFRSHLFSFEKGDVDPGVKEDND